MKFHKLSGIIINRSIVKDADRFLTIYTKEEGKLSVYAKGVRSLKSKRAPQLDLFSHIKFELIEKNNRWTLTSVELLHNHHQSKTKLSDISRLFQIGELVDLLTPEQDPHIEVYDLLQTALLNLSRFETPLYLFRFKKKLLHLLGYGLSTQNQTELDTYIESLVSRPLRTTHNLG